MEADGAGEQGCAFDVDSFCDGVDLRSGIDSEIGEDVAIVGFCFERLHEDVELFGARGPNRDRNGIHDRFNRILVIELVSVRTGKLDE